MAHYLEIDLVAKELAGEKKSIGYCDIEYKDIRGVFSEPRTTSHNDILRKIFNADWDDCDYYVLTSELVDKIISEFDKMDLEDLFIEPDQHKRIMKAMRAVQDNMDPNSEVCYVISWSK